MKIPKKTGKRHLVPIVSLQNMTLANNNLKILLALWIYLNHDVTKTSSFA